MKEENKEELTYDYISYSKPLSISSHFFKEEWYDLIIDKYVVLENMTLSIYPELLKLLNERLGVDEKRIDLICDIMKHGEEIIKDVHMKLFKTRTEFMRFFMIYYLLTYVEKKEQEEVQPEEVDIKDRRSVIDNGDEIIIDGKKYVFKR